MDIPCGGLPAAHQLHIIANPYRDWVYHLHRSINHIEHVTIPRSQTVCDNTENCKSLRVTYLLNQISRDDWRNELYRQEKYRQKHLQYIQIYQTYVAVCSDWLRRVVIDQPTLDDLKIQLKELYQFINYIHTQINILNSRFKSNLSSLPETVLYNAQLSALVSIST